MTSNPTVLISGAGGQLGRRAVELLLEQSYPGKIVAGTRDPARLADFAAQGVEVRRLDWEDEASLASAFKGVDRVLLISGDQLQNRSENQVRAVKAAAAAGVEHVVYTSMVAPERYRHIPIAPSHLATEEALAASGIGHTLLQNMWYTEGLLQSLPRVIASGRWESTQGERRVAYVSREDCARTAVAALSAAMPPSGKLVVTGPAAVSVAEIAAIVSELTGKPIEVVPATDEQAAAGMRAAQLPEFVIDLVVGINRLNREGGAAQVTDVVERLTGRKPQSVADFLRGHAAALKA
jgi:NAD(P)H dehydrogenase (quinone)